MEKREYANREPSAFYAFFDFFGTFAFLIF